MKIIEPKVELWKQGDDAKAHVARCARVCSGKMTASDYTHLFGYLNPYYRSAYNIPKRRK